jgi:hypothetical protein
VPAGQFLQYRIEMAGGDASVPALHWIGFTHDGPLPGAERRAARATG